MGDLNYANEKLNSTVHSLATGPGDLRTRLESAWAGQGHSTPVVDGETGFPDLADRLRALRARMTSVEDPGLGPIAATVQNMPDRELLDVAFEIMDLSSIVEELYWREQIASE